MNDTTADKKVNVTRILGVIAVALFLVGVVVSLVQHGSFERIWHNIVVRPAGPFGFRFFLQPAVAAIIAVIDGLEDARAGRQPYFWMVAHEGAARWDSLMEGLRAVANVVFLSVILDTIYQLAVTRTFYPFETVLVTLLLAFVPYLIVRGPAARLARHFVQREPNGGHRRTK